jgi:hypothetical protein
MGILPMSLTGVPPVSLPLLLSLFCKNETEEAQNTGETPVRLIGETPMLLGPYNSLGAERKWVYGRLAI